MKPIFFKTGKLMFSLSSIAKINYIGSDVRITDNSGKVDVLKGNQAEKFKSIIKQETDTYNLDDDAPPTTQL